MAAGSYVVRIKDSIDSGIAQKITGIAQASNTAATSAGQFAQQMHELGASQRAIAGQRNLAKFYNQVTVSCNKTTASLKKSEAQHVRAALAARKYEVAMKRVQLANYGAVQSGARLIGMISRYTALLGIAFNVNNLIEMGDAYTNLQNKLKTVTTTEQNLKKVTDELYGVALRTRIPIDVLATSFVRFDLSMRSLGKSQAEVMKTTETITQLLKLGGAGTEEASAALLQLSQAFNKNKLDGDEFKSVAELMPLAMDAFAKKLGVTRGELNELGAAGVITGKLMAESFAEIADDAAKKYAERVPTISEALTVMGLRASKAWGEFDKAHGISEKVAKSIIALSKNLDEVGKFAGAAGAGLVGFFVVKLVPAIYSAIKAALTFNAAMLANPIGLIATGIGLATAALVYFSDEIIVGTDGVTTLREYAVAAWELITENAVYMVDAIKMAVSDLVSSLGKFWKKHGIEIEAVFKSVVLTQIEASKAILNGFIAIFRAVTTLWNKFPTIMGGFFIAVTNQGIEAAENIINAFMGIFFVVDKIGEKMAKIGEFSGNESLAKLGKSLEGTLQVKLPRYKTNAAGDTVEGAKEAVGEIKDILKNAFSDDPTGKTADAIGQAVADALSPLQKAIDDRVNRNAARRVTDGMIHQPGDDYYNKSRPYTAPSAADVATKKGGFKGSGLKSKTDAEIITLIRKNANVKGNVSFQGATRELLEATLKLSENSIKEGITTTISSITDSLHSPGSNHYAGSAIDFGFYKPGGGLFSQKDELSLAKKYLSKTGFKGGIDELYKGDNAHVHAAMNDRDRGAQGYFDVEQGYKDTLKKANKEVDTAKIKAALAEVEKLFDRVDDSLKSSGKELDEFVGMFDDLTKLDSQNQTFIDNLKLQGELFKMSSEEAEKEAKWLDYIADNQGAANELTKDALFKQLEKNRLLEIEKDYREEILANSSAARELDIANRIKAASQTPGLSDEDKYNNGLDILSAKGFDVSYLEEEYNQRLMLEKNFRDEVSALVQMGVIEQKMAADIIADYEKEQKEMQLEVWSGFFGNLSALQRSSIKEVAMVGKAAAIAQALIDTYAGANKALGAYPPPFGKIAAAGVIVAGLANVAQIRAQNPGFKSGGFTGHGNPNEVAGTVHRGEFVMNAQATSRLGVGNLQSLQDGSVRQAPAQPAPVVVNNAPPNVIVVSSMDDALNAMSGREGETIFLGHLENNKTAVARMLS